MKTRITELLGIKYPILLGGLQGLGLADLAAAVSEAGGLGLVTAGCFETGESFKDALLRARSLTSQKIAANVAIGSRKSMDDFVDICCELSVPIVVTSGNNPEKYVSQLKAARCIWVHVAPAVRYAVKAEKMGADAVVLVGFEAGGHPGMDEVALSVLIRRGIQDLTVPIIAAGAISDGASIVAALALGAEGVQIGTRFVLTQECMLHDEVKNALVNASERDTVIIERTMRKSRRVLNTAQAKKVLELEAAGAVFEDLKYIVGGDAYLETVLEGRLDRGVFSAGQCIGLIDDTPKVAELFEQWIAQMGEARNRLQGMLATI